MVSGIVTINEVGFVLQNLRLSDNPMLIICITHREVDSRRAINLQRTGPIVITFATEFQCSNTELVINVRTTNPQGGAEQRAGIAVLGQVILGHTAVVPHVTIAVNQSSNIVDVKFRSTLGPLTCGGFALRNLALRVGFHALDAFTRRYRSRHREHQQGKQNKFAIYTFHL